MKEFSIVGKVRDSGTYKGHDYDNVYYYCVSPKPFDEDLEGWGGNQVVKLKITYALYENDYRYQHDIGDVVVPTYDRFGNVREIRKIRKGENVIDDRYR